MIFCQHNSLVQVVSLALGGSDREDVTAGATTAEGAISSINSLLSGG